MHRSQSTDLTSIISSSHSDTETALTAMAVSQHKDTKFSENYGTLKKMARARLRLHKPFTMLGTTALVHESYLKLNSGGAMYPEEQTAFLHYVGQVMRSVIVDAARTRLAKRRGANPEKLSLDDIPYADSIDLEAAAEIVLVHDALDLLAHSEDRLAKVLTLSYFAGMSENEIGLCLSISDRTVRRDNTKAHMLMRAILSS